MNRPLVSVLLVLAAAVVPFVLVSGVVGLVLGFVLGYPLSVGQVRALVLVVAGAGLLLVAHLLDRQALARTALACHLYLAGSIGRLTSAEPAAPTLQLVVGRR